MKYLLVILSLVVYIQNTCAQYVNIIPGWKTVKCVQTTDGFITFSVGLNDTLFSKNIILIGYFDDKFDLLSIDSIYDADAVSNFLESSYAVSQSNDSFMICSIALDSIGQYYGSILVYSADNLRQIKITDTVDIIPVVTLEIGSDQFAVVNYYDHNDQVLKSRIYKNLQLAQNRSCSHQPGFDYCNLISKQAFAFNDGIVMVYDLKSDLNKRITNGLLSYYSQNLELKWNTSISDDSTTCNNTTVISLNDTTLFCIWSNIYYKPYTNPNNSPYPQTNGSSRILYATISNRGLIKTKSEVYNELKSRFYPLTPIAIYPKVITKTKEGDLLVTGFCYDYSESDGIHMEAVLIKFNKFGEFIWFEKYHLNLDSLSSNVHNLIGWEAIELNDGSIIVSCEYQSISQNSSTRSDQKAIVIHTDRFGKILSVPSDQTIASTLHFQIIPNPVTNHSFQIVLDETMFKNLNAHYVSIFDISGRLVYESNNAQAKIHLFKPGIYFVRLFDSESYSVQKLVIQ